MVNRKQIYVFVALILGGVGMVQSDADDAAGLYDKLNVVTRRYYETKLGCMGNVEHCLVINDDFLNDAEAVLANLVQQNISIRLSDIASFIARKIEYNHDEKKENQLLGGLFVGASVASFGELVHMLFDKTSKSDELLEWGYASVGLGGFGAAIMLFAYYLCRRTQRWYLSRFAVFLNSPACIMEAWEEKYIVPDLNKIKQHFVNTQDRQHFEHMLKTSPLTCHLCLDSDQAVEAGKSK